MARRALQQGATTVTQTGKTSATTLTGRTYKAFWYVPALKRWVKSVEEYYDPNGIRYEGFGDVLEGFKVSD